MVSVVNIAMAAAILTTTTEASFTRGNDSLIVLIRNP